VSSVSGTGNKKFRVYDKAGAVVENPVIRTFGNSFSFEESALKEWNE